MTYRRRTLVDPTRVDIYRLVMVFAIVVLEDSKRRTGGQEQKQAPAEFARSDASPAITFFPSRLRFEPLGALYRQSQCRSLQEDVGSCKYLLNPVGRAWKWYGCLWTA